MDSRDFTVIAFDTSKSRTGWAVLKGKKVVEYGNIIPPKEYQKITYDDSKWGQFLKWYFKKIYSIVKKQDNLNKISFAVLEDLHIMHKNTARILHEVQAVAKLAVSLYCEDIPLNPIHNTTAKSNIGVTANKKNYTKEIKALAKQHKVKEIKILSVDKINELFKLDLSYEENDESDAIMLAYTMICEIEKFKD
jgi:Holliday junction resolvasome RuvABC endonuclease subunit